jgi:hypothetical protein
MSQVEYDEMLRTGLVQESHSGTTYVAYPAESAAYERQASPGSLYVEFTVTDKSVATLSGGWAKILGPNTIESKARRRRGLDPYEMPKARRVVHVRTKG